MKKRIVVVCQGRGSYTANTLNYLRKYRESQKDFLADLDMHRSAISEIPITQLDARDKFSPGIHTRGEHASLLIYAASYCDYMSIDREKYEVVAICGNSLGWYLTLALAGCLNWDGAFQVIQTMGSMMKSNIIGGQIIYPVVDDQWQQSAEKLQTVRLLIEKVKSENLGQAYVSIFLGGYLVIGGDQPGLQFLLKNLPKSGDYPFQLLNHAAFHTPLLYETSQRAFELISCDYFYRPSVPAIDGRGHIWQPYATDLGSLYKYTLGHQVYAPYDFTKSITVALKEFMPDYLWLLGPGTSLGGAIGQILVQNNWRGLQSKDDFKSRANEFLITME